MKNIIKIFIIALCLSATACANNNSSTDSVKTDSSTIEISTSSNVDSIEIDSSNESSEIDSSETDSSNESSEIDSSEDESSKAVTTTKTIYKETAKATTTKTIYKETAKATTTTKQTTTQPAVTTKPYVAPTTTTQKPVVTTKPAVQTTKTTTKATTKSTTKQTTKTTTNNDAKLIASLNPLEKAMYNLMMGDNSSKNIEFIRQEFIKYGKSLKPNYVLDKNLYLWVDKNGKPTNNAYEAVGFTDYACSYGACGLDAMSIGTTAENIQAVKDGIYLIKRSIEDHLLSIKTDDDSSVHWYIQITRIHPTYVQNGYNCFVIFRFV